MNNLFLFRLLIPGARFFLFSALHLIAVSDCTAQKTQIRYATASDVVRDSVLKRVQARSCGTIASYIPDTLHPEFTPFRKVRINIHVIQDGKGQHNFSGDEGRRWILDLVQAANARLAANQKMNLPVGNRTPVLSVPFRFVLTGQNPDDDGIYFHRDDSLFCMNKKARGKNANNVYDKRQYEKYGTGKDSVINVFLMEHCPDSVASPTYKASNDGVGPGPWAKVVGCFQIWSHPTKLDDGTEYRFSPWDAAGLLNHELGHCLGLAHTWNTDDGCDDTPKNAGCWNVNEPAGCTEVSNNVMDYNAYKNALSPCQIGKMNMNFYNDKLSRRFLVPEWCTRDSSQTVTIARGESVEWNGSVDVYGNLVIENKARLTIRCTVSLPPGARIILMPEASLTVDGGLITSRCQQPFDGIEIRTSKKSKPAIFLKNGASIENTIHPL